MKFQFVRLVLFFMILNSCRGKETLPPASQIRKENFCKYYIIKFSNKNYQGKDYLSFTTDIANIEGDVVSQFMNRHPKRFDYLGWYLFNDSFLVGLMTDSNKLREHYCKKLSEQGFYDHFSILAGSSAPIVFTEAEMMKVASRFFHCDRVNKLNREISYSICIGKNGQEELNKEKDYLVLQAFVFEAIGNSGGNRMREIEKNFSRRIRRTAVLEKRKFTDLETYLLKVRNDCYQYMESDSLLRQAIKTYYEKNKDNIGFKISS